MAGSINKDFMDLDIKPKKSSVSIDFNQFIVLVIWKLITGIRMSGL